MKEIEFTPDEPGDHVLNVVEEVLEEEEIAYDREDDDNLTCDFSGRLCEYYMGWSWLEEVQSINLACSFDMVISEPRLNELRKLICQINQELWLGHFDIHTQTRSLMLRVPLVLGNMNPTPQQCRILLQTALQVCEKYYQSFQSVVLSGKTTTEAMQYLMIHETQGRA